MTSQSADLEGWLPGATLAEIIGLTVVALALGLANVQVPFKDDSMRVITYGIFIAVAVLQLIIARLVVIPTMARTAPVARRSQVIFGYAESATAAIFSVGGSIVMGNGLFALPLGGIGLLSWLVIWSYLRELPETSQP